MLKIYFSLIVLLMSGVIAKGQPTLDYVDYTQFYGQSTTFFSNTSTNVDTNIVYLDGANQTWDYGNLVGDTFYQQYYADVAGLPFNSQFPNANLGDSNVFAGGIGVAYGFYELTNSYLTLWGIAGVANADYIDPVDNYVFPFNYQQVHVDSFETVQEGPGLITTTYDGYGTLISPLGTFTNVVRVKNEIYKQATNTFSTSYLWVDVVTGFIHFSVDGNDIQWVDQSMIATAIDEATQNDPLARVYPTIGDGNYQLENLSNETLEVTVLDISGRMVFSTSVNTVMYAINLTKEPAGVYLVRVVNQGGHMRTLKIVKQ